MNGKKDVNKTDISGWSFQVEEVSAGVYRVRGVDEAGRSIEVTGMDPDIILEECKRSASEMKQGEEVKS